MTLPKANTKPLSQEELDELTALKNAITYSPQTVSTNKMEKFAELMVRSLEQKQLESQ